MRKIVAGATAALVIAASPLLMGASAAHAADDTVCIPSEAWTETIVVSPEIPAVPGIPAVPEIPEVSHMETVVIQEAWTETVVDREAWDEEVFDHWQHYSWTGGPHLSDEAPGFPGDNWQANVQGDPHGVGVAGAYYVSHGGSGNGDWFYLDAVTRTVHHDAETHTVEHPAVTAEVKVIDQPYVPGVPEVPGVPAVPAVTEEVKVIDQEYVPGVPAVPGTPAIPAVTMEIEHPAVECPAPAAAEAAQPTELAKTGGSTQLPILFAGAGAIGLGLTAVGVRHLARK